MKRILQMGIAVGVFGAAALAGGYAVDNQRCKQINYEKAGYELPETWLLSAKQCFDAANAVRLRGYARTAS